MSTVLVTGAGRGLGRATALRLAASGWDVYAGVRDPAAGEALVAVSSRITPLPLDVTDPSQVAGLRALPELDALVNNAGIAVGGPIETTAPADVRHQFEVNVVGQVAVTQAVLPRLRDRQGRIVFVSSLNGRVAIPMSGIYDASKFALEAVADALRVELRPWRIGVTLVEPGCHDTDPWRGMMELLDGVAAGMSTEHRELYAAHIAGQRELCARLQKQVRPAENVAAAVEEVLTARRPPARRLVGPDARLLVAMRRVLPTRVLDRVWANGLGLPAAGADPSRRARSGGL
jgi:NAD(P)-dependent dehydrogenase (short-subunit alcohol dehydrogenase family)